jgi:hypothetical protein
MSVLRIGAKLSNPPWWFAAALLLVLGLSAACGDPDGVGSGTCSMVQQDGLECTKPCQPGTVCALVYAGDGPHQAPKCVTVSPACGGGCVSCECMAEEDCPMCSSREVDGQTYLSCDEYCGPYNENHCA